ncbi:hydrogenase nickel incorporation protein HypB [Hydrogenophaga sp. 5NK40-0174]|uniref:hydrogenase nickel incorporation protein HypB n=1 Tax=Hydrogenophaga sp. 5NK40-0174 TaxID=3127649 RepID=UPI0031043AC1
MCVVCGCSDNGAPQGAHDHDHDHGQVHDHHHGHTHSHAGGENHLAVNPANGDLHYGAGSAKVSVPGMSQARAVKIETDILGANNRIAQQNRAHFASHGVTALNFVSSPGSGKTTLLCETITAMRERHPDLPVSVIEGDQQTSFDADRIRATGAPAIQVNTGKGCHLDAPMVAEAFSRLHSHDHDHGHHHHQARSLLLIENVGNLVCPAMWDLGEKAKVSILSVTEGEDKPLKYPDMFAASELMILNKIDLLPHVKFNVDRCIELARRVNPSIRIIQLSATTGEGMDDWLHWIEHRMDMAHGHAHHEPSAVEKALQDRVAQLEAELAKAREALGNNATA